MWLNPSPVSNDMTFINAPSLLAGYAVDHVDMYLTKMIVLFLMFPQTEARCMKKQNNDVGLY